MEDKGYIKFKGKESQGAMHCVLFNDKHVSITLNDSRKVKHIKEEGKIGIAENLRSREFKDMAVTVVEDKTYAKEVFEYMLSIDHCHYSEYDERLVVIEYPN